MTDMKQAVNIDDCAGFIKTFGEEYSPYLDDPKLVEIDLGTFSFPQKIDNLNVHSLEVWDWSKNFTLIENERSDL